jgi:threonine dehydrogenase-like Zn-dependent dehydrogenase
VPSAIRPGAYVVASVRRPGSTIYGMQDFTTDDVQYERGINLRHGFLTELYVEDWQYVFPLPEALREVGVLLEPTTVAEKGVNHAYEIQRRLKVWEPRSACVLGAGTIGLLTALVTRLRGLEVTVYSQRRRPYRNGDLIEELGGVYVSSQDATLAEASSDRGPFDLMFEATGFSPLVWEAAEVLGKNGVLVLASITGADRRVEIASDRINQSFVLGNKVMFGTVNASPNDFRTGVDDLIKAETIYPGWLAKLLTTPIHGLENYDQMIRELTENRDAIKVYVDVAANA